MPDREEVIFRALQIFAEKVTQKSTQITGGESEDQLRGPFENLMRTVGEVVGPELVCTGETQLPDRLGKPDYAIHASGTLAGYVELKAPGKGANAKQYTYHDREQWERFQALPNLIYTDGSNWALFRSGEREGRIVHLAGDVSSEGKDAVERSDGRQLLDLMTNFLSWGPSIPVDRKGNLDVEEFTEMLAPLCRMIRENVTDALQAPSSPLVKLASDWRDLLFPDADDAQFADAYAQTVTFALLLARSEGADPLTFSSAESVLSVEHSLLSRALQVLTDSHAREEISAAINTMLRIIGEVPPQTLTGPQDPWLYFYEDFLAAYDPELRKNTGVYYTPIEVVRAQVRLIDDLLTNRLDRQMGFAHPDVVTLDPGVGTGTYLLGVIDHALGRVKESKGEGAVAGGASTLAENLYGFEKLVGPFAVSQLRLSRALENRGAELPEDGPHIYLTDTLESPYAEPPELPMWMAPISEQHERALEVKDDVPVIVCLGNPPYDRHVAVDEVGKARTGNWVRWGGSQETDGLGDGSTAILRNFVQPVKDAGEGGDLKNLYNLYVYFWRWALWKVFEADTAEGPGVVSFISASSYLDGTAFLGMREHMRRVCDEIWIIDLGGEGRGTRRSENVFSIQTPVAIAVAVRSGSPDRQTPAEVKYSRIKGLEKDKREALESISDFDSLEWSSCHKEWKAPFRPAGSGHYYNWPFLVDLFPWQHSGVQPKRTWPIAPSDEILRRRWKALLQAEDRANALRETGDRTVTKSCRRQISESASMQPIATLSEDTQCPSLVKYAFRSYDRQFLIPDVRLISRHRPPLWSAHSDEQIYLTTLLNTPLGKGPALTAAGTVPDLHHFRGSYGAKEVFPLYRDEETTHANVFPGLLDIIGEEYGTPVSPLDFLAYVYGILAQPEFTDRFYEEVAALDEEGRRQLRVPITKEADLFERVREAGAHLLWLHTYGERYVPDGCNRGEVPQGRARCTEAVPQDAEHYPEDYHYNQDTKTLHVGEGKFHPVEPEVYEFEVSGLKVVQSWLGYRMKDPSGKRSSPLDDITVEKWPAQFTTELLELLWILEKTVEQYPRQAELLEQVVEGECFTEDELPDVPEKMRKAPKKGQSNQLNLSPR